MPENVTLRVYGGSSSTESGSCPILVSGKVRYDQRMSSLRQDYSETETDLPCQTPYYLVQVLGEPCHHLGLHEHQDDETSWSPWQLSVDVL